MNEKKNKFYSIKTKYTITFGAIIAFILVACWIANLLFLGRFYISRKTDILRGAYNVIEYNATNNGYDSGEFTSIFDAITSRYNLSVLVMNSDMDIIASNTMNKQGMSDALLQYFFKRPESSRTVFSGDRYTIERAHDDSSKTDYIQLFGLIANGDIIIIRTPISSIKDSAEISNLFLEYIGIGAILISILAAFLVSKSISQPILKLVDISDKMAHLDFDVKYEGDDNNEIGILGDHMNVLSEKLEATISELKAANIELKKDLEKKNEIDEMRREFLSNVSHELKTPIALIQGYAEGLTDCVNDDEDSKNFYCEVISDEASKMNRLVQNLLQLNELEFGQNTIEFSRFDIVELIKNCVLSVDILLKQNDIKFIFNHDEPIYVWSDEFKIEQVVNNYVSNAIHYADGDKKVLKISIEKSDDKYRINVFNTGKPIPEESLQQLWTKFYKVDKARTREYGGSGVGLSIVKAAMDALDQKYGVINYENGVTFWFEVDGQSN